MSQTYCCDTLQHALTFQCDIHDDPFSCPDALLYYAEMFDEYGILIHDGTASYQTIDYCPWCAHPFPPSKRDLWFDTLEQLGYDDPWHQNIPTSFTTDEWYQEKKDS